MSAPLPSALRARFQKYVEEGLSGRAAALRLRLSPATGARWARQVRTSGHILPAPQGRPPGCGKLAPHQAFFEELIAQDPDITLFELRDALADAEGVQAHQLYHDMPNVALARSAETSNIAAFLANADKSTAMKKLRVWSHFAVAVQSS